VRDALLTACGLRLGESTSHCFDDFNHVACCAMSAAQHDNTNEESRVVGMHPVNFLGDHIVAASDPSLGIGGSWCSQSPSKRSPVFPGPARSTHTPRLLYGRPRAVLTACVAPGALRCTCQLSAPHDVCHRQFGARTAWTLVWCKGTGVASLVDDDANVLATGKPYVSTGKDCDTLLFFESYKLKTPRLIVGGGLSQAKRSGIGVGG